MIVINSIFLLSEQATNASGFFEVQILSLTNNRGTLVDGRCCGGGGDGGGKGELPPCTTPCSTAFWLCLKEYQSNVTAIGSCSFGNVSSHALGQNTFTLSEPVTLQLHFTFRWTVSGSSFSFDPILFYYVSIIVWNCTFGSLTANKIVRIGNEGREKFFSTRDSNENIFISFVTFRTNKHLSSQSRIIIINGVNGIFSSKETKLSPSRNLRMLG